MEKIYIEYNNMGKGKRRTIGGKGREKRGQHLAV